MANSGRSRVEVEGPSTEKGEVIGPGHCVRWASASRMEAEESAEAALVLSHRGWRGGAVALADVVGAESWKRWLD